VSVPPPFWPALLPAVAALSTTLSTAALDKHPQSRERGITLDLGFSSFTVGRGGHMFLWVHVFLCVWEGSDTCLHVLCRWSGVIGKQVAGLETQVQKLRIRTRQAPPIHPPAGR